MTYAVIAYLAFAGQLHAFKIDHGLTLADCRAELASGAPVEIAPGFTVDPKRANAECFPETPTAE